MGKSVMRHPGRTEAEQLIREGKLRRKQICERCGASPDAVRRWARALGIKRIRATKKGAP